jgi:RNA polymerase sigma-70 factor (ECF subfamily)
MDDGKLIELIKGRDQDAMVALHTRYADLVYSIGYRVLNDAGAAEECVQDTFMRVWTSGAQYDPTRGSLVAWLVSIARNIAIDRLRQRGRQVSIADDRDALDDTEHLAAATMPDYWRDRERVEALRLVMQGLPAEQFEVLHLSYYGGLSQSEIAAHLNIPLGTVKTRMRLGMQKLREAWNA